MLSRIGRWAHENVLGFLTEMLYPSLFTMHHMFLWFLFSGCNICVDWKLVFKYFFLKIWFYGSCNTIFFATNSYSTVLVLFWYFFTLDLCSYPNSCLGWLLFTYYSKSFICLFILSTLLINITSDVKALCMIGKPWRKMDFHGGYAAFDVHRIYMMNSG